MKKCTKCGQIKPREAFYPAPQMRDGYRNDCKACNLAAKAIRYRLNPQAAIERTRRWRQENPERYAAAQRRIKQSPTVKRRERARHLEKKYGIGLEQYEEMLAAQGGGCAICGKRPRPDSSLHVDHDHGTGEIRGLLCFNCNNALGYLNDDGDRLITAATYLGPAPKHPALVERLAALRPQPA